MKYITCNNFTLIFHELVCFDQDAKRRKHEYKNNIFFWFHVINMIQSEYKTDMITWFDTKIPPLLLPIVENTSISYFSVDRTGLLRFYFYLQKMKYYRWNYKKSCENSKIDISEFIRFVCLYVSFYDIFQFIDVRVMKKIVANMGRYGLLFWPYRKVQYKKSGENIIWKL